MTTISTTSNILRTASTANVYVSSTLTTGTGWGDPVPKLFVDRLEVKAAPDVDECVLRYDYGLFAESPTIRQPQETFDRQYVKVEIVNASGGIDGLWYGIIEVDERDVHGTRTVDGTAVPQGVQKFTAYGLMRLLERARVEKSVVADENNNDFTIERALPFNLNEPDRFGIRGNRTNAAPNGVVHSFAWDWRSASKWRANEIAFYLLERFFPVDDDGNEIGNWVLDGAQDALQWYDVAVTNVEGRTVKDLLDEIIDRRRLVGWHVRGFENDAASRFDILVVIFSFNENNLLLPNGQTLFANGNQFTLEFDQAVDIETAILRNNHAHRYDRIVVRGEFITSTFTLSPDVDHPSTYLESGWKSSDETSYKNAAGTDEKENTRFRQREVFNDVYSRWVVADGWDLTQFDDPDNPVSSDPRSFVIIDADVANDRTIVLSDNDVATAFDAFSGNGGNFWHVGRPLLQYLPWLEDLSAESEFPDPFLVIKTGTNGSGDNRYEIGSKLNANAHGDEADDDVRKWSTTLYMLDSVMGIRVDVGASGGQQLIAEADWGGAAATPDELDPTTDAGSGLDWRDMRVTVAVEWDARVQQEKVANVVANGQQERLLVVDLPGHRLDFEIPGTVRDVLADGTLELSTGKIVRDNRQELQAIANVAAEWYGVKRQALSMTYKQIDPKSLDVGNLITSISSAYADAEVNSVLSAIVLDFNEMTTTLETSYASFDLAALA